MCGKNDGLTSRCFWKRDNNMTEMFIYVLVNYVNIIRIFLRHLEISLMSSLDLYPFTSFLFFISYLHYSTKDESGRWSTSELQSKETSKLRNCTWNVIIVWLYIQNTNKQTNKQNKNKTKTQTNKNKSKENIRLQNITFEHLGVTTACF